MKPEFASKLADCGISVLESPSDVVPMVLKYLGKDPDTINPADFDAVVEAFKPVRQFIKTFDASNYLNALPNKEVCVVNNWSGDYATAKSRAKEAGIELNLAYYVPDSGAPAWFDLWCITKDAPHLDNAYKFINYLRPGSHCQMHQFHQLRTRQCSGLQFTDKAVLDDPAVFPTAEIKAKLWTPKTLSNKLERARTRPGPRSRPGRP